MRRTPLVLLVLMFFNSGCALFGDRPGPPAFFGPRERPFAANFEEVWKAVNLVLQPYPLRTSNMDQGVLETDAIRGNRIWAPPYGRDTPDGGQSYKLTVKVLKGAAAGTAATRVTILKDASRQTDFFSESRQQPSDGLEEDMILYRVGREIQIERALARAQKRQNLKQN